MGLCHVGQVVALIDANLHRTALHHGEEVIGHGLSGFARCDVGEQGLARQVQRALGPEHARRDGRHRARRVAEAGHQAEGAQAVQAALEGVLADRVVDHLHALAAGDVLHPGRKVFARVVDGVRRAVFQRQRALGRTACRADELQAQRTRPLAGDQPHATGSSMEEHEVAGLQAFDGQRLLQQVLRGQSFEHHAGCGVEGDAFGQPHHVLRGHHARFAVAAGRVAGVSRTVARMQVRHALAHCLDDARAFHAQQQRQRVGVQAGALVDVDEVQAAGVVANADFARARRADLAVDDVHLLGAAEGGDLDGAWHERLLWSGPRG